MRRREFIKLLSGAATAWPFAARAQQSDRVRRIATLLGADVNSKVMYEAFRQELRRLGWVEGSNVRIDTRFGGGDAKLIRKHAAELVALSPDVILSTGGLTTELLLKETRTLPIVFTIVPDPVGSGLVDSLSQPGGNATGFMQFENNLSGKWLELLKEIVPSVTRAAVFWDPTQIGAIGLAVIQSGAITRCRCATNQCARCVRDRTRHRCVCEPAEWRIDCDSERIDLNSSRTDQHACGQT
jgi:putative ABC transport system substrate-binding protein